MFHLAIPRLRAALSPPPRPAQAIEVIRFLKAEGMPIERASMKFVVDFPTVESRDLLGKWVRTQVAVQAFVSCCAVVIHDLIHNRGDNLSRNGYA